MKIKDLKTSFKEAYMNLLLDVIILLGGTVHLVCRNRERGEEAKTEIAQSTGNQVEFISVFTFAGLENI